MATGSGINQGKTAFVGKFLSVNPDATFATVNEAWKSAGNEGTVSESLVDKARSKLGLTGRKGTKGRGGSKSEDSRSTPNGRKGGTGSGKSAFVKEILGREPKANVKAINRAWTSAGNEGTISDSVVYKIKRGLATAGRRSPGELPQRVAKPERAANPVDVIASQPGGPTSPRTPATLMREGSGPGRVLHEIEGEIDELLFRLKGLGDFPEVQEALRSARRLLVRSHAE